MDVANISNIIAINIIGIKIISYIGSKTNVGRSNFFINCANINILISIGHSYVFIAIISHSTNVVRLKTFRQLTNINVFLNIS